jgi:uncharacterized protein YajQ (UPF0234 family)
MAQEYSFDVVSRYDLQELMNAVNQAQREIATRYDFKGTDSRLELDSDAVRLEGPSEFQLKAMLDILKSRMVKRQVSLKVLQPEKVEPAAKGRVRQAISLQAGISDELARDLVKRIKSTAPKVQARIQGDVIRVSSREKDVLQTVIKDLRVADLPVALQFVNYR